MSQPVLTSNESTYYVLAILSWTDTGFVYTYRYSCGGRSLHVGSGTYAGYYQGSVLGWPVYTEERGDGLLPRFVWPSMSLEIARSHDNRAEVDTLVSRINTACESGYKPTLTLYFTSGASVTASDRIFTGTIDRGGMTIKSNAITLKADHWLRKYDIDLPNERNYTDKNQGDPDAYGKLLPVIYGQWMRKPDQWLIPAYIVERRTEIAVGSNYIGGKICDPNSNGIHTIFGYAKWMRSDGTYHGFDIRRGCYEIISSGDYEADYSTSTFYLDDSRAEDEGGGRNVWKENDKLYLEFMSGNEDSDGDTITDPVNVIYDLLTEYAGVSSGNIGDTITPGSGSQLTTGFKCRAYLDKESPIITGHINDICQSFGLILAVIDDKFEIFIDPLYNWEYGDEGTSIDLTTNKALDSQSLTVWPEKIANDRVKVWYDRTPDDKYRGEVTHYRSGSSTDPAFEIKSNWIYRDIEANFLVGYMKKIATAYTRQIEAYIPMDGLQSAVTGKPGGGTGASRTQRIKWTGDGLTDEYFYPWKVEIDYGSGLGHVWAYQQALQFYTSNAGPLTLGTFSAESTANRQAYAFATGTGDTVGAYDGEYSNMVEDL